MMCAALHADSLQPAGESQRFTSVVSLDGEDWKIATDPDNTGREQGWFDAVRPESKPTRVPWVIQQVFPQYHGIAWYWKTFETPTNPHEDGRFLIRFHAVDYLAEVWVNGKRIGRKLEKDAPSPGKESRSWGQRSWGINVVGVRQHFLTNHR